MKIIRHLSPTGPAHAALQPDGSAREISGDILGDFKVTDRVVKPGKLLAPLVPVNILAIGLNYKRHAEESGKGLPAQPMLFMKSTNSVQNPGDPIEIPMKMASTEVDYECELAVVIGKSARTPRRPTRSVSCSATPARTTCRRATGRSSGVAASSGQGKGFDTFCRSGR